MEIEKKLHDEIKQYCKLNNLKISEFINSLLKKAFMIEKYGETPFNSAENIVEESTLTDDKSITQIDNEEMENNSIKFVEIKKSNKRKLK